MAETMELGKYIIGEKNAADFYIEFAGRFSEGFDVAKDLQRLGVINQTTQLATDTQAISDYLKQLLAQYYQLSEILIGERFADTRDTLCYATNDNQTAVTGLLQTEADLAIVIGGYNSSNTSHLVELCEQKLPTYFIDSPDKLMSKNELVQCDWQTKEQTIITNYLPQMQPVKILVTSGASCPDAVVEAVIEKLISFYQVSITVEAMIEEFV